MSVGTTIKQAFILLVVGIVLIIGNVDPKDAILVVSCGVVAQRAGSTGRFLVASGHEPDIQAAPLPHPQLAGI